MAMPVMPVVIITILSFLSMVIKVMTMATRVRLAAITGIICQTIFIIDKIQLGLFG